MKIIIMGPQGCGKSTQAEKISEKLNIPHISTGDIFRKLEKSKSPLGIRVFKEMSSGKLVSDGDIMLVIKEELLKQKYKGGFIIDGFPRNVYQAKHSPFKPNTVLYLKVSKEVSFARLIERKRGDDTPKVIKTRLSEYYKNTTPVLDYYEKMGILRTFNGEQEIEGLYPELIKELLR